MHAIRTGTRLPLVAALTIGLAGGLAVAPVTVRTADAAATATVAVAASSQRCAGTVTRLSLPDATAPDGRRSVWVWRPPGTDARTIPVLYLLHGDPGGSEDLERAGIARDLNARSCAGAPRVVVVAPDGSTPGDLDSEWADDAQGRFRLESFVTGQLIRAVEAGAPRDRRHRALAGFSMGGFAAVSLGLRHPSLYGTIGGLAGYYRLDDPDHVLDAGGVSHDPQRLIPRARSTRVLLGAAADDAADLTGPAEAARYAALLRADGQSPSVVVVPGGHSLASVRRLMPSLLALTTGSR